MTEGPKNRREQSSMDMCLPKQASMERIELRPLPDSPLVSIVVPSYNQGQFIRQTIDSILSQEYRPLMIHVVDGASCDNTRKILESYGNTAELDWTSSPDNGVAEAVNKGLFRSDGQIIGIQSSDDTYLPGAIQFVVDAFKKQPEYGLIYGDIESINADGESVVVTDLKQYTLINFLTKQTWIPQPSSFFRREIIEGCGGWNEEYFNPDTELWLRMVFRTKVWKINQLLAQRRLHDEQRNKQKDEIANAYKKMILNSRDLQASSWSIRRAARAGVHIHCIKYNVTNSYLTSTMHLWSAIIFKPKLLASYKKSPLLIPGWLPLMILLSALKRRLFQISQ